MSTLLDTRYQFDPTGQSPSNYAIDEPHEVPQSGARLIVFREGLIYTPGFTVRLVSSQTPLVPGVDYHFVSMDAYVTALTGIETAAAIEFVKEEHYGEFLITAHYVGGHEGKSSQFSKDLAQAIETAKDSPVDWHNIYNKPAQYPPAPHTTELETITGWEALTTKLHELKQALLDGHHLGTTALSLKDQDDRILWLITEIRRELLAFQASHGELSLEMEAVGQILEMLQPFDLDFGEENAPREWRENNVFNTGTLDLNGTDVDENGEPVASIEDQLLAEAQARQAALNALRTLLVGMINAESSARQDGDSVLDNTLRAVIGEVDGAWRQALALEAQARLDADIAVSEAATAEVDAEAIARQQAINALSAQLAGKLSSSLRGVADGVASLDSGGKVPESQLPPSALGIAGTRFVDTLPASGEGDILYIRRTDDTSWHWTTSGWKRVNLGISPNEKGAINGVATLDNTGKVPPEQLPPIGGTTDVTWVDPLPASGETDMLYIRTSDLTFWYWTTEWVQINSASAMDTSRFLTIDDVIDMGYIS